jgi:hypothetical protein
MLRKESQFRKKISESNIYEWIFRNLGNIKILSYGIMNIF